MPKPSKTVTRLMDTLMLICVGAIAWIAYAINSNS